MQLSRFVLTYHDVRPGEHVLYDIIRDHYVGVDDLALQLIGRSSSVAPATEEEREICAVLREQGLLVQDTAEDDGRLRRFLEAAAEGIPGTMYVTLMPTLACNLACSYCFQKDHPAFTKMKSPTEEATVEWILRKVDAAASRRLVVHYFGGEPLTRKDFLLRTAEIFSTSMRARGAEFEWEITTNGIGLTVELARAMLQHGPGAVKVTLDGDKETHDSARVYRNGKGTFEEIFTNTVAVAHACPELRLRIGGNFRAEQRASYERLLDRLQGAGLAGRIEMLRFKPVVDTGAEADATCTSCAQTESEADTLISLAKSAERRRLSKQGLTDGLPSGPCELHWKNSYIIDPEGKVYKCPAVAGRPELAVDSVTNSIARERLAPLLELRPWEQCGPCPYMPVCVGGCLGGKYLQTGRRDEVFCRKSHFEKAFKESVTARYLAEFAGPSARDAA